MPPKAYKLVLRLLVLLLLGYGLYWQLCYQKKIDINSLLSSISQSWQQTSYFYLLISVLLMPVNWFLELYKWLILLKPHQPLSYWQGIQAILAGLTVSLFTPNRIGEYGGRILLVQKPNRPLAVWATLSGNLAQWLILLTGGLLGWIYFIQAQPHPAQGALFVQIACLLLGIILLALLTIAYFYQHKALDIRFKWQWIERYLQPLRDQLQTAPLKAAYLQVLGLAAARYAVYTLQYLCLLYFFGLSLPFLAGLAAIGLIYLIQTGLPIPPATGLMVRANVSVWLFDFFIKNPTEEVSIKSAVLLATLSLWLLNILIPALGGWLVIFKRV